MLWILALAFIAFDLVWSALMTGAWVVLAAVVLAAVVLAAGSWVVLAGACAVLVAASAGAAKTEAASSATEMVLNMFRLLFDGDPRGRPDGGTRRSCVKPCRSRAEPALKPAFGLRSSG